VFAELAGEMLTCFLCFCRCVCCTGRWNIDV